MIYKLYPKKINGTIDLIASKSLSHRYLIAASLCHQTSVLENVLDSVDIKATIDGLTKLGANIELPFVSGKGQINQDHIVIDAHESGSTLRFLIPLALLTNKKVTFIGVNKLRERPLDTYLKLANEHQFHARMLESGKVLPFEVQGPLRAGIFEVEGHVSSQFLTGLIFALSSLKENSTIVITTPLESIDYVYLTIDVLKHFGVDIVFKNQMITIKGGQTFNPVMTRIEGDYSQSAFLLIAGVLGGYVELKETSIDSLQGDKRIINILQSMGARLEIDNHHIKAFESKTFGTHIDLTHTPDLGPVLMILAALSQGNSTFTGLERLKYKESDRLAVMIDILQQFDVKYHLEEGTLTIEGRSDFAGGYTFDTYNDHRIAMALAVAAIKCRQPIMIKNPHVVSKSYPDFFKDYVKIGGYYEAII